MTERRIRRRPGENRERLQEAGLIEFGLFGFHGTSTGRIAARASVPQPHVYANFRTKQELFLACVSRAVASIVELEPDPRGVQAIPIGAVRVVYQAYATAQDPALASDLSPLLRELEQHVEPAALGNLLVRAAGALRSEAGEHSSERVATQLEL